MTGDETHQQERERENKMPDWHSHSATTVVILPHGTGGIASGERPGLGAAGGPFDHSVTRCTEYYPVPTCCTVHSKLASQPLNLMMNNIEAEHFGLVATAEILSPVC